jgi:hypothetical protein
VGSAGAIVQEDIVGKKKMKQVKTPLDSYPATHLQSASRAARGTLALCKWTLPRNFIFASTYLQIPADFLQGNAPTNNGLSLDIMLH